MRSNALRFQVPQPSLRILAPPDQPSVLRHLEVPFNLSLNRHVVGGGKLAHRGVPDSQPSHDVTPGRIGQGGEDS